MDNLKSTRTIHNTIWDDKSQSLIVKTCVMHYTVNDDLLEVNFLELFQSSFFRIEFFRIYRIYRICRKLLLVILKMKIVKNSFI